MRSLSLVPKVFFLQNADACEDKTSPSARGISTNDLDSMKARARHMAKIAMFPSVWDDDGIPRQM